MHDLDKVLKVIKKSATDDCIDEKYCFSVLTNELRKDENTLKMELTLLRTMKFIRYYPGHGEKIQLTLLGKETDRIFAILP